MLERSGQLRAVELPSTLQRVVHAQHPKLFLTCPYPKTPYGCRVISFMRNFA